MKAIAGFVAVALVACRAPQGREAAPAPPPSAAVQASRASLVEQLDRLDRRKSLPLLPVMANHQKQNMREHLTVVQEVVSATATRDFAKVGHAAQRMGYSEAMGQMCEHMGAGAAGFSEQALAFHHSADRIADAARTEDSAAILGALGETLAACTACHATYKQTLVDKLPGSTR
jgi:hypothetical protein